MAQIPAASADDIGGYRPSTAAVAPTDLGLGTLAQGIAQAGQINAQADRKLAQGKLLDLQGQNETAFAKDAAAYTGDNPGFAADQVSKAQSRLAAAVADPSLSPGVKNALVDLGTSEVARIGQQAISHEANVRAKPIAELAAAAQAVPINAGITGYNAAFEPARQALMDSWDGATPGLADKISKLSADTSAQIVAAAPDQAKGTLKAQLDMLGVKATLQAQDAELQGKQAFIHKSAIDQANAGINTITSSPLAYDGFVQNTLPGIVATLPASEQKSVTRELTGQAAVARINGLLRGEQVDQAQKELDDGRYDAFLDPKVKEGLEAKAEAAAHDYAPKTLDEAVAQRHLSDLADAQLASLAATGKPASGVDLDTLNNTFLESFGPHKAAEFQAQQTEALRSHAATGDARSATSAQLQATIHAPPPATSDPNFAGQLPIYQAHVAAANAELKARLEDPGALAQRAIQPGDGGAQRAALWGQFLQAPDRASRQQLGMSLTSQVLGLQEGWGTAPATWAVAPNLDIQRLAGSVTNAPPGQKGAAMSSVATLMDALPANYRLRSGQLVSPQQMVLRQLQDAGMKAPDLAALRDFGDNPAKLGIYAAAASDPSLQMALPKGLHLGSESDLKSDVANALQPFLASVSAIPAEAALSQGRLDRTALMARWYMANQNMNMADAAKAAASDLTGKYSFVDSWRAPTAVINNVKTDWLGGQFTGADVLKAGMARALGDLTANSGRQLFQNPNDPNSFQKIQANAKWISMPDDSGVQLMRPVNGGGWAQVGTRYGQPVSLTWSQVARRAQTDTPLFQALPPGVQTHPDGTPVPMPTPQRAQQALIDTLQATEHSATGSVSPAGALGRMQLMPDTVKTYAPRLGLPIDLARAQNDDGYGRQIATAAVQDLQQHYGPNGTILSLIGYNAGRGRLDGYSDPATGQYHPGWLTTIGDPRTGKISWNDFVARIPFKETRNYVQKAAPDLMRRLGR